MSKYCANIFKHKPNIPDVHWLILGQNTVAIGSKANFDFDEFKAKALKNIKAFDGLYAGSLYGDFNPIRMEKLYPSEPVWMVQFSHDDQDVLYYGLYIGEGDALNVGLLARSNRDMDAKSSLIVASSQD
ncbi:hypothetical protein HK103_007433 [Boothiomyces macroporosus]|uniref:Uncharacterized protein n=1 Tax=Boothiomyces macroporosus TaxID=261099 RepID=A0AAD5YAG3_9FUNG|nr:hypothetical protein HK103_007433 [Boothiomyces macroporosus]